MSVKLAKIGFYNLALESHMKVYLIRYEHLGKIVYEIVDTFVEAVERTRRNDGEILVISFASTLQTFAE